MSLDAIWHRRNPTPSVSVIKVSTVPGLSRYGSKKDELKCSVEDGHKYETTD